MVTLLTDYNTRRYTVNSDDDTGDLIFHNGDQVLLMDQDLLLVYDEEANQWYPVPTGGGGGDPQYGFVDAAYVGDTWQGSVSGNVFTLTYPNSTTKYFQLEKPIVLQPGDVLKVECKLVSGTSSFTDLKISAIPQGAGIVVEQNFLPSATVHASVYTNSNSFPLTVVGMGYCTRSTGGGYNNTVLHVRVSLNDVVLFSSIT